MRWVSPPGWPDPPSGWVPPAGWQPDPTWPPAPPGWKFWWHYEALRRGGLSGWWQSLIPAAPFVAKLARATAGPISKRRAWTEALGVFALFFGTGVVAALILGNSDTNEIVTIKHNLLGGLDQLAQAGLAIVVVLALSKLRGLSYQDVGLAPRWSAGRPAYRWQALGVFMLFTIGTAVSFLLLHLITPNASYPNPAASAWNLLYDLPAALAAGIVEELVVVALVVTVLEQAGTRVWVIFAVGIALRLSYHVYYGPGVIALAIWAAINIWIYRRTRRVTPLIVAHVMWDGMNFLSFDLSWGGVFFSLYVLALFGLLALCAVRMIMIVVRPSLPERAPTPIPARVPQ